MSYARGRSATAQKERTFLRRHPGTIDGTIWYLEQGAVLRRRARARRCAWIDRAVRAYHREEDARAE